MSTDDEFARALRERADAAVPAMSLDPAATLRRGRRHVRTRHAWQVGSVVAAVGVVAVAVAPTLPMSSPTSNDATAQVGVSSQSPTPHPSSTFTGRVAGPDSTLASAPGSKRVAIDSATVLGASVVAQAKELQQEMFDAMDTPYDAAVWDDFSYRLDALVAKADAANARHPHSDAVELGYFVFPDRYTHRLTSWIGWDNANRITLAWDADHGMLRKSAISPQGVNSLDSFVDAVGSGALELVVHDYDRGLHDGSELTYQDRRGKHYTYDVFNGWVGIATTAMARPAPASGYTVDVTPDQRTKLESLSAQSMSSGSGLSAANELEPLMSAVASTRHPKKDTGDHDVVTAGLTPFGIDAPHGSVIVPTKDAQWNGWVDGRTTVVIAGAKADPDTAQATSTGQIRLVAAGNEEGTPYSIKGTGSLTLESESQGVLTLRDAHGATHRFDLATTGWI
ncbi:hypothetical protein [Luteimicrobium sp. DT211]|uniref:hypothetical protein n=1 Tax=Luteimicrobium sp. DT211 TaxID=3393412 RepID=UPI003CF6D88B